MKGLLERTVKSEIKLPTKRARLTMDDQKSSFNILEKRSNLRTTSNHFIKKADFLMEREELNEEDLEVIVNEINKQEGEFKDRNPSKQ